MKHIFTRSRPAQSPDPHLWFQGAGHYSFPSGEVTAVTAIVTPFVLEYGREHPAVYALELLPAYDAIARVKAITAPFEVEYAVSPRGRRAEIDETLTMAPPPVVSFIAGMT